MKIHTVRFVNLCELCSNKDVEEWIRLEINETWTYGDASYTLIHKDELHLILKRRAENPSELELELDFKDIDYLFSFVEQLKILPVDYINLEG